MQTVTDKSTENKCWGHLVHRLVLATGHGHDRCQRMIAAERFAAGDRLAWASLVALCEAMEGDGAE